MHEFIHNYQCAFCAMRLTVLLKLWHEYSNEIIQNDHVLIFLREEDIKLKAQKSPPPSGGRQNIGYRNTGYSNKE